MLSVYINCVMYKDVDFQIKSLKVLMLKKICNQP